MNRSTARLRTASAARSTRNASTSTSRANPGSAATVSQNVVITEAILARGSASRGSCASSPLIRAARMSMPACTASTKQCSLLAKCS
ncbi:Uncharacterised protein [Mycobacteroides abscessus subsp. abscessus]|nr:Uncharacterised protein [Mycobacteroides abscessus subsp. abscessus]